MDQGPLVSEDIEAGARFLREFQKHIPVQAAFWLKDSDDGNWHLYVASDQITDENFDDAYGVVSDVARARHDPAFDSMLVKVVGTDNPLARAMLDFQQRYPGRAPTRYFRDRTIDWVSIAEVYIYPASAITPAS
jgi:hypothetical protein